MTRLIGKVIDESVTDVDSLEDALEVPDVIQQPTVEHLNEKFEEAQNFLLLV